jgi:hypothetical protein
MARVQRPDPYGRSGSRWLWTFRCSPATRADLDFVAATLGLTGSAVVRQLIRSKAEELRATRTAQQIHAQRERAPTCPTCGATIVPGAAPHHCLRCALCHDVIPHAQLHHCAAVGATTW